MVKEVFNCRVCSGELQVVWDMGSFYPAKWVTALERYSKYPLVVAKCGSCDLVQLKHDYDLDSMYRDYYYRSNLNSSMLDDLQDVVKCAEKIVDLNDGDQVVDIGCNSADLFTMYTNKSLIKIGFDPALNLKECAEKHCDYFINDYFSAEYCPTDLQAKVVTSIAMFYDVPQPSVFIEDVKKILAKDGIWIIQFTDLLSLFQINAFESLCFEHVMTYSFSVLCKLLQAHDLTVFDVDHTLTNGGSLRAYVCFTGERIPSTRVLSLLCQENDYFSRNTFTDLIGRSNIIKNKIKKYIYNNKTNILGASTKGSIFLQYCGIDDKIIEFAGEVNSDKFNKEILGTGIKIIPEKELFTLPPHTLLCLPWHFSSFFLDKPDAKLKQGWKLLFPMPDPVMYRVRRG